jgi:hypothetical protein
MWLQCFLLPLNLRLSAQVTFMATELVSQSISSPLGPCLGGGFFMAMNRSGEAERRQLVFLSPFGTMRTLLPMWPR